MTRFAIALVMALLLMPRAGAQSDSETTTDSNDVSVELGTFSVSGGTPGSWIQAALARHAAFVAARVNAARNGETPGVHWTSSTTSTTTGTTTTSDTSSSLSTLLSQYSGSLDSLDSLSSLLASLTATSSGETTSTKASTSSSKSSGTQQSVDSAETSSSSSETSSSTGSGVAIARLPKASALYATSSSTTDDADKFSVRLADSLMDTLLSTIALEFQSADFIDFLKTQLEPLILPSAQEQAGDSNTDGS